jgi:protein-S-isoprenylcysteine O-methyltransferase Ste14
MDVPGILVTAAVLGFWIGIGAMIVRVRRHTHRAVGVVPEQRLERFLWVAWVPLGIAWVALPWLALTRSGPPFGLPEFARALPWYGALRWAAALVAVASLVAIAKCWSRMGKDWRMAVTAEADQTLITDGLFTRMRHPIYAFSMLLVAASVTVVPTPLMILCGAGLVVLWIVKAFNEERHMLRTHGEAYARYLARTGRFFPRSR